LWTRRRPRPRGVARETDGAAGPAAGEGGMKVTILNPKHVVFEGEARSVFLPGDRGEFELLDFHAPIVSLLRKGPVVLDWDRAIPIKEGMVKFDSNECTILVEE
jgi:F-type H+-transporting ATPase subunit epsilon